MITGGLDLGSSGCKFSVYDGNQLIAQAGASYYPLRKDGRHTLDSNQVWRSVCDTIKKVSSSCDQIQNLVGFAVSSLGEAAVPMDKSGNALGDALLFWDRSGVEEAAELAQTLGSDKIAEICGVKPHSMFTVCKIAWQKKHADYFRDCHKFMLFEDFIIYRLTGEAAISYSLAGRTMGFDYKAKKWSSEVFAAAGIDLNLMSTPVPSGTVVGKIKSNLTSELGLPSTALVITGGHDQMCAALGVGAIRPGISANGSGTVEALSATLSPDCNIQALVDQSYSCAIHADPNERFTYSFGSTGSMLLNWFVDTFKTSSMETQVPTLAELAYIEQNDPGVPTDLMVLPYVAGTGTPYMDIEAKGLISGMTVSTTKFEVYRALLEGLTYDLAINIDALTQAGVHVGQIRATGGGSKSSMWLQIKADVTGREFSTLKNLQAGTLGCKMLVGIAMGEYQSLAQAVEDNIKIDKIFYPNMKNHDYYKGKLEQFKLFYKAVKQIS